jgi:diguanylate cyclase (GGDEF)-like protein
MYNSTLTSFYVWTCIFIALVISFLASFHMQFFGPEMWLHFCLFVLLIVVLRLRLLNELGFNVGLSAQTAAEIAALIILPFPLFCLAIILSVIIDTITNKSKYNAPLFQPELKGSILIISGLCASSIYSYFINFFDFITHSQTIAILPTAIVFAVMKLFLQSTYLSIKQNKPIINVETFEHQNQLTEAFMVAGGAIVGRIYQLEPALLIVMLIPILLLNKSLIIEAKLAYIDSKTGLYNYRYFDENITKHYHLAKKTNTPLSLIFADIDYLRDINNAYGHFNGDLALKAVANVLKDTSGPTNIATRFGGEEFVLIVPELSKQKATALAELIRKKVHESKVVLNNGDEISVSISLGVASYPEDTKSLKQLISYADKAVYEAKHLGRNKVCNHDMKNRQL